jgi:hypothetical protein
MSQTEDNDYIRRAVELADGWELLGATIIGSPSMSYVNGFDIPDCLDALAAQLRRQVFATGRYAVHLEPEKCILCRIERTENGYPIHFTEEVAEGDDESINTIKCIVDFERENPGVLG